MNLISNFDYKTDSSTTTRTDSITSEAECDRGDEKSTYNYACSEIDIDDLDNHPGIDIFDAKFALQDDTLIKKIDSKHLQIPRSNSVLLSQSFDSPGALILEYNKKFVMKRSKSSNELKRDFPKVHSFLNILDKSDILSNRHNNVNFVVKAKLLLKKEGALSEDSDQECININIDQNQLQHIRVMPNICRSQNSVLMVSSNNPSGYNSTGMLNIENMNMYALKRAKSDLDPSKINRSSSEFTLRNISKTNDGGKNGKYESGVYLDIENCTYLDINIEMGQVSATSVERIGHIGESSKSKVRHPSHENNRRNKSFVLTDCLVSGVVLLINLALCGVPFVFSVTMAPTTVHSIKIL
eukprot:Awhi_evm1s14979